MNLNHCRVVLRARNPLDVFDLTIMLMRDQAMPVLRAIAGFCLPVWLFLSFLAWWMEGHWSLLFLAWILGGLLQAPFTICGGRILFSAQGDLKAIVREVVQCTGPLIGVWLVSASCWALSSLTCFLAHPFLEAARLYHLETILLERVSSARGMKRCLRLSGGHYGLAVLGALFRWVLIVWMALLAEAAGQFVFGSLLLLPVPFGSLLEGQITPFLLFGFILAQPVLSWYRLLMYVDIRTRMEGWDLQVGLRALALGDQ